MEKVTDILLTTERCAWFRYPHSICGCPAVCIVVATDYVRTFTCEKHRQVAERQGWIVYPLSQNN